MKSWTQEERPVKDHSEVPGGGQKARRGWWPRRQGRGDGFRNGRVVNNTDNRRNTERGNSESVLTYWVYHRGGLMIIT